jgi:DeoD family purine-nucleoside phosphorylase
MYHLKCKKEDVSPRILVCGDPGRVEKVSKLLMSPRLVNGNRGLLTFTGTYKGERVTVSTTGMGAPSAAIVMEELAMLGAKTVIRVGTTGGIADRIQLGDVVVPNEAVPLDGATQAYLKYGGEPVPDMRLTSALVAKAERARLRCHIGKICTSDTFYLEEVREAQAWASKGALSFEMECSVIFTLGKLRGYMAGAILTVTGIIGANDRVLDDTIISESVEKSAVCALDTVASIDV